MEQNSKELKANISKLLLKMKGTDKYLLFRFLWPLVLAISQWYVNNSHQRRFLNSSISKLVYLFEHLIATFRTNGNDKSTTRFQLVDELLRNNHQNMSKVKFRQIISVTNVQVREIGRLQRFNPKVK